MLINICCRGILTRNQSQSSESIFNPYNKLIPIKVIHVFTNLLSLIKKGEKQIQCQLFSLFSSSLFLSKSNAQPHYIRNLAKNTFNNDEPFDRRLSTDH